MWAAADMEYKLTKNPNIPTKEQLEQALIDRVGPEVQRRLSGATVAICGLGGLGSNIAVSLARAGVGTLILIDFDRVDLTNLNRQQYKVTQLGQEKSTALADNLREINPWLHLIPHAAKVTEENLRQLVGESDVVCEAFDRADQKSMLVNAVLEQLPQTVLVSASGMAGLDSGNTIRTRRVTRRLYLCGDGVSDVETLGSLFAPRVALCAAHQALTVLRVLTNQFDE